MSTVIYKLGEKEFSFQTALQTNSMPLIGVEQNLLEEIKNDKHMNHPDEMGMIHDVTLFDDGGEIAVAPNFKDYGTLTIIKRMKALCITILVLLMSNISITAFAYDITIKNDDGITIGYIYINDGKELEVAYLLDRQSKVNIVIPDEITYKNRTRKVTSIGEYSFSHSYITGIKLPNTIVKINDDAFFKCQYLTNVELSNTLESIGKGAFGEVPIKHIELPNSLKDMEGAFMDSGLESIVVPKNVSNWDLAFSNCHSLTKAIISNGVSNIGAASFRFCESLTQVEIPNTVQSIGNFAFDACSSLKTLTIPSYLKRIGDNAFSGCTFLYFEKLIIPNSVTYLGNGAFARCKKIKSVVISNNIEEIYYETFKNCSDLSSITIGNKVQRIGNYAFDACPKIKSLVIPNSVKEIETNAFRKDNNLTYLQIGSGLESVGYNNFFEAKDLMTVVSFAKNPPSMSDVDKGFSNDTFYNATLYVPKGTKEKYKKARCWKNFLYIEEGIPTDIDNRCISDEIEEISRYSYDGTELNSPRKGLNIIKMSDGTTKKILVK